MSMPGATYYKVEVTGLEYGLRGYEIQRSFVKDLMIELTIGCHDFHVRKRGERLTITVTCIEANEDDDVGQLIGDIEDRHPGSYASVNYVDYRGCGINNGLHNTMAPRA